jgi:hypothetical protein
MTDARQSGTEWVPPIGLHELPPEQADFVRGLYELAAFVVAHPQFQAPRIQARFYLPWQERSHDDALDYPAERDLVEQVASALGVQPTDDGEHYTARRSMGMLDVSCTAITPACMAAYDAHMSYRDNVRPEGVGEPGRDRRGARRGRR